MIGWMIVALGVGGALVAGFRLADRIGRRTPRLSPRQKLIAGIRSVPWERALDAATDAVLVVLEPLRADVARHTATEARRRRRADRLAAPVLGDGLSVVHVVAVAMVSALAVFFFVANRELDISLLLTNHVARPQAVVVGTIIAAFTALLGMLIVELLFPTIAFPKLKAAPLRTRLAWALPLVIVFLATVSPLPNLASARAETLLGGEADRASASCRAAQADATVDVTERELACTTATRLLTELSRARDWDRLVAVAAPVGEAASSWAVLRLLELGAALAISRAARRATDRRVAARHRLAVAQREFVALVSDVIVTVSAENGDSITPEQIAAWRARQRSPIADVPEPGSPAATPPAVPTPTPTAAPKATAATTAEASAPPTTAPPAVRPTEAEPAAGPAEAEPAAGPAEAEPAAGAAEAEPPPPAPVPTEVEPAPVGEFGPASRPASVAVAAAPPVAVAGPAPADAAETPIAIPAWTSAAAPTPGQVPVPVLADGGALPGALPVGAGWGVELPRSALPPAGVDSLPDNGIVVGTDLEVVLRAFEPVVDADSARPRLPIRRRLLELMAGPNGTAPSQ